MTDNADLATMLVCDLFEQVSDAINDFKRFVADKEYEKNHQLAHKLKSASLQLGFTRLSEMLKQLEYKSSGNNKVQDAGILQDIVSQIESEYEHLIKKKNIIMDLIKDI